MYNTPTDSDEYLGKYDENLGSKDHVGVTYFYIKTASTPSGGGNVNWTGNQSACGSDECQHQRRSHLQPQHGQSDLANVHAGHGRTRSSSL